MRPGEKVHEIMVSEEECRHCVKRGEYYAILPMLPELREEGAAETDLSKEFSSEDSVVSLQETVALLERHGLLLEQADSGTRGEMLV